MERQKFEESFREAFEGAEVAPSDMVWTNVELTLEKSSSGKIKRSLLFFQLLAAASLVFAMGIGGSYYLNSPFSDVMPSSPQEVSSLDSKQKGSHQEVAASPSELNTKSIDQSEQSKRIVNNQSSVNSSGAKVGKLPSANEVTSINQQSSVAQISTNSRSEFNPSTRSLPRLVEVEQPIFKSTAPESHADPGMIMLAKLRDEEKKYQSKKEKASEKLWASVGASTGTFNPNATTSSHQNMQAFGASTATSSNPSAGSSYSIGASVAGKISRRVVLQGGISYLSQNAEYTSSSAANGSKATLNEALATANKIEATSPYQVNSNLQYVSIPLQAGYIVVDQKFAVQLNGGVSTDFFIQNTLTPETSSLDKVTQKAGSDSPYRTVNFSGLVGTELSYKMGDHYRVAVNPGLRYALNSIYKSEVSAQISPITFDVGLRFRYIFN